MAKKTTRNPQKFEPHENKYLPLSQQIMDLPMTIYCITI